MSMFSPRNLLAVIGTMLGLIALYLVLTHFLGAEGILKSLSSGAIGLTAALQGR